MGPTSPAAGVQVGVGVDPRSIGWDFTRQGWGWRAKAAGNDPSGVLPLGWGAALAWLA